MHLITQQVKKLKDKLHKALKKNTYIIIQNIVIALQYIDLEINKFSLFLEKSFKKVKAKFLRTCVKIASFD